MHEWTAVQTFVFCSWTAEPLQFSEWVFLDEMGWGRKGVSAPQGRGKGWQGGAVAPPGAGRRCGFGVWGRAGVGSVPLFPVLPAQQVAQPDRLNVAGFGVGFAWGAWLWLVVSPFHPAAG
ncbi:hypothetical protein D6779_10760 [Candidatus Parcubacteria bacterium]|nr:MAG: hypothetical protein D6779_10760 [Candidatus Parcubacteria bacterium]